MINQAIDEIIHTLVNISKEKLKETKHNNFLSIQYQRALHAIDFEKEL